ncbi:MAG: hypothetical protein DCC68_17395 [Planctomycetota bacterium]|nr:MAG: hypothetical protein DCC68_17395 [Planctomycetota bacterium]
MLAAGSLYTGSATAQEAVVVEAPQPIVETVRWRRPYRPYYRPYYRSYYRPYSATYAYRPYAYPYYVYGPYWSGYYYYGPRVYYW